jgi:uncharacterized protein YkwD
MPRSGAILLLALAAAGLTARPGGAATGCPDSGLQPYPGNLDRVAGAIVCEINVRRTEAGLHALRRERRLDRSSQFHSDDMVESRFVAHEQPGHPRLVTRIRRTGYFRRVVDALYTENVAVAPQEDGTAANLVTAWMLSDRHRANILFGRFREIGVGARITGPDPVFYSDRPSVVYTTDFGRRYWRRGTRCARRSLAGQATPPRRYCTRRRPAR